MFGSFWAPQWSEVGWALSRGAELTFAAETDDIISSWWSRFLSVCSGSWSASSLETFAKRCLFLVLTPWRGGMCFYYWCFAGGRAETHRAADCHHLHWTVRASVTALEKWCNTHGSLEREDTIFEGCMQRIPQIPAGFHRFLLAFSGEPGTWEMLTKNAFVKKKLLTKTFNFLPAVPEWLKIDCRMVNLKNPASTTYTKTEDLK